MNKLNCWIFLFVLASCQSKKSPAEKTNEVLTDFKKADSSLARTRSEMNRSASQILDDIKEMAADGDSLAQKWYRVAQAANQITSATVAYIDSLGIQLQNRMNTPTQGKKLPEENTETATRFFIKEKRGKQLFDSLWNFRQELLGIDTLIRDEFRTSLPLDRSSLNGPAKYAPEKAYFNRVPAVAALTMLSKLRTDVEQSGWMVIAFCYKNISQQLRAQSEE